ncbi:CHAP domain-containing protein [Daejeonella lutea]|uniref:CHAP domain-containing protein n=1 Tax=Daejeonella lutea TaxID=572036 RepID=A0A1T5DYH8_9SPHI|nr:CHAP domain-containing protein [Daejeonella lutea]SKB76616.1 hypothetical protein SAMN05661099_2733 [Daejeonella lutea]
MATTKRRITIFSTVLRIVYISVLVAYLLLWGLSANGQTSWKAGLIRCPYPPPTGVGGGLSRSQDQVRKIYTSQIGVREKQTNAGTEVEKYLHYVGLTKGNPWCAAFVCWSLGEAKVGNPRSGWSPDLFKRDKVIWCSGATPVSRIKYQESRLGGGNPDGLSFDTVDGIDPASRSACPPRPITDYRLLITNSSVIKPPVPNQRSPEMGDVFGLYFPEKGRIAHVGFVDEWKDGWVTTVEGNTNVLGSRDGDGVYRKRRLIRSICKVARYVE